MPLAHEINAVRNQQVILDRNLTELDRMEAQPGRRQVISGKYCYLQPARDTTNVLDSLWH
ncbi:MAG: hypothetical protein PUF10_01635 [Bacteroidales bacterium]|nr:hypothetical protein [Bacteroidales bacterium]